MLKKPWFYISLFLIVWILLFDRYNLVRRYSDNRTLEELENDRDYYLKMTEVARKDLNELFSDQERLEKFARERYFMKKDSEDVFIIEPAIAGAP